MFISLANYDAFANKNQLRESATSRARTLPLITSNIRRDLFVWIVEEQSKTRLVACLHACIHHIYKMAKRAALAEWQCYYCTLLILFYLAVAVDATTIVTLATTVAVFQTTHKAMKWKRMCNLNCHTVETVCRIKCTRCLALALALALSMHKPTRFYANTICNIIIIFDASSTATPLKIISSKLCYIYFVFHLQSTPIPSRVEYDFFGNLLVSRCWHAVYGVRCWKI